MSFMERIERQVDESNSLHYGLDDMSGTITADHAIPAQLVRFRYATVQFSTLAVALATPAIYFEVPWLGSNQLTDNNPSGYRIPILTMDLSGDLASGNVISVYNPDIEMSCHSEIPSNYTYRFTDKNGQTLSDSNIISVNLLFEYHRGIIS